MDSPYALLSGALHEAKAAAGKPAFVEVSGDLLVHDFNYRYRTVLKLAKATGDDQSVSAAFAAENNFSVRNEGHAESSTSFPRPRPVMLGDQPPCAITECRARQVIPLRPDRSGAKPLGKT